MKKFVAGLATMTAAFVLIAPVANAQTATPNQLLELLIESPESNSSSYTREAFRHWIDSDRDGCDTREEVLIAESRASVRTGRGCAVLAGSWFSSYDNRGIGNPSGLDVDHMVPLKEAWESGASGWTAKVREAFANDLDFASSLIAVSASSNRSKGDRDPSQWVPTNRSIRCGYAVDWILVKYRWSLSADAAEIAALDNQLRSCSSEQVVRLPEQVVLRPTPTPTPTASPQPAPSPSATQSAPTESPTQTPAPTATATPSSSPTPTPTPSGSGLPTVSPGAFCAAGVEGTQGVGTNGTVYTCKRSATDSRLRWRV
jgi:hypothetical protein